MEIDVRDPRNRYFGHIEPENMDPAMQTQDRLALSASMRTALLVYSGISVKMMVDSDLGADLSTMFMVQYEQGGFAGAHDHPLEEAYLILEGEVEANFDGAVLPPRPGRCRLGRRRLRPRVPQRRATGRPVARDPGAPATAAPFVPIRPRLVLSRKRTGGGRLGPQIQIEQRSSTMDEFPVATSPAPGSDGSRLGEPGRLRAAPPVSPRPGAGRCSKSSTSAPSCYSRRRTSATPPPPRSATGPSTRASAGRW